MAVAAAASSPGGTARTWALARPQTTAADVASHHEAFAAALAELVT